MKDQDTEDLTKIAELNSEYIKSKKQPKTPLPKSRVRKGLIKSEPNISSDTANLKKIIDSIEYDMPFKNYDRLDNAFTKLRHKGILSSISLDILIEFVNKMKKIITGHSEVEFTKKYLKEAKNLIEILEPSKVYLNLVGCPDVDQRLLIDEVIESILKLIQNSFDKLIIPLSSHPTKEFQKILDHKYLKTLMASLCSILEYLCFLLQKKCIQEQ